MAGREVKIDGNRPVPAILAEIETFQAENDRIGRRAYGFVKLILGAFALTFTGIAVVIFVDDLLEIGIAAIAIGFCSIWILGAFLFILGDESFDMDRPTQLKKLLVVLGRDVPEDQPLSMTFDGRGRTDVAKTVGQWKGRTDLPRSGVVEYEDPWLELSYKMAHGTAVRLFAEERCKERRKPRRKGRIKRKVRSVHRFKVRVAASPRSYAGVRKDFDALAGTEEEGLRILRATHQGRVVQVAAAYRGAEDGVVVLLRLLSRVFAHLQPALSAKQRKRLRKGPRCCPGR